MSKFKKGTFFKTEGSLENLGAICGVAIDSKHGVIITSKGKSGFEVTHGPVPKEVSLVKDPVETFKRYELKLAFSAALAALNISHDFET